MLNKAMLVNNTNNKVMKKVKERSGGLLILVVLILAVAMVLITSALMMTVASRDRYYNNALTSQASLTAASVAKTIASAAEIGDLTKADLNQLVTLTQTNPLTVTKNKIDGTLSITPGLEGVNDASGNAKTSFTNLKVEYSNLAKTNFKLTVNTYLDAGSATSKSQQTVTIFLTENLPVYPAGFGATLNVFGSTQIPNVNIGFDAPADAKSNFVTFTGAMTENNDHTIFGGDLIITSKVKINGNMVQVNGDLILLGSAASLYGDWGSSMPVMSPTSYFLDLCESGSPGSTYWNAAGTGTLIQSAVYGFKPAGILLKNADMKFVSSNNPMGVIQPLNSTVYTLGTGKVLLDGANVTTSPLFTVKPSDGSMDSLVTKYTSESGVVQQSLSFTPPPTRAALMTLLGLDPAYAPLTGTALKNKLVSDEGAIWIELLNNGTISNAQPLTAPAYYIDSSLKENVVKAPITFDLTNNSIDVFIIGNSSVSVLDMTNQKAGIRFIRPAGSTNIGRVIFMQDNTSINLNNSSGTTKYYCGISGAGMDPLRYEKEGGTSITDGSEPYIYIYGFNNNITANTSSYVEGYYGLYGTGSFYVPGGNNKLPLVYARFDLYNMNLTGGNATEISYCPAPGEGTNSDASKINPFVISGYITS